MLGFLLRNVQILYIFPFSNRLIIDNRSVVSIFEKQDRLNSLICFVLVQYLLGDRVDLQLIGQVSTQRTLPSGVL